MTATAQTETVRVPLTRVNGCFVAIYLQPIGSVVAAGYSTGGPGHGSVHVQPRESVAYANRTNAIDATISEVAAWWRDRGVDLVADELAAKVFYDFDVLGRSTLNPTEFPMPTTTTKPKPKRGHARQQVAKAADRHGDVQALPLDKLHNHPANPDPTQAEVLQMVEWLTDRGQDEAITVRPLADPVGHYEVLAGKTRLAAATMLGLDTLDARIRTDLADDQAAIDFIGASNAQRRTETPIRQALVIQAKIDAGCPVADAGKIYGLQTEAAVRNKLQLLRLPKYWQQELISGEMAESCVRQLVPYVVHPAIDKLLQAEHAKAKKEADRWPEDYYFHWTNRNEIARTIDFHIGENSRPMDDGDEHHYGYQAGSHPRLFDVDASIEKKLQVVALPLGKNGAQVRRALNVAEYDKLQKPLIKQVNEAKANGKKPSKTAAKKKLTPAAQKKEDARKAKEAAAQTAKRVTEWRHHFLRVLIACHLRHGSWEALLLHTFAAVHVRDYGRWSDAAACAAYFSATTGNRLPKYVAPKAGAKSIDWWDSLVRAADPDDDPITNAELIQMMTVRLLLFPWTNLPSELAKDQPCLKMLAFDEVPQKWPYWNHASIERIAEQLGVTIAAGWKFGSNANNPQRMMVQRFFELHTRGQVEALTQELTGQPSQAKTKAEAIDWLMQRHATKSPLPLPASLGAAKSKTRRRKKRTATQ